MSNLKLLSFPIFWGSVVVVIAL